MSYAVESPVVLPDPSGERIAARRERLRARARSIAIHPAIGLTLLTAFGGALRFWKLAQPALWGDEVATFRRVCGTFQQLIDQLAVGGFTPLHYLLYYWIGQHTALTPTMMRLPTAIFGTLLIPAMYFLARQLVRPPVAMLVAAFTACSAYQLNFSRDAKMYSDLWLCGTLHMACFLWWLRTRSATAWWGWVAAGTAMMGVQFIGAALYPIELLIVLTAPRGHWRNAWALTRYVVWWPVAMVWLPIHAIRTARVIKRRNVGEVRIPPPSPLYAGERDRGRGAAPQRVENLSVTSRIEAPPSPTLCPDYRGEGKNELDSVERGSIGGRPSSREQAEGNSNALVRAWLGTRLTLRRWRRQRTSLADFAWPTIVLFSLGLCIAAAAPYTYYVKFNRFFSEVYNADQPSINWGKTGITWVAGYNAGRDGFDLIRYTATAYAFGWEWPKSTQWVAVDERTGKLLIGLSIGVLLFAILGALPLTRRLVWVRRRFVLWISIWLILPAYAFYCASMPNAVSPFTWIEQLLLKNVPPVKWPALPIGSSWELTWQQWQRTPALHELMIGLRFSFATIGSGFTRANLNLISIGILLIAVLAWTAASLRMNRRSFFIASQTAMTLIAIFLLCVMLRIAIAAPFPRSVWMPRYLAFIWPAFAILLATLFYRLPTRPIRWVGIAVLLIGNLSVHGARVLAGSEPPTELMARDILDCQPPLQSRLFSSIPQQRMPEPGTGVLDSSSARYYLAILSGKPITPDDVRDFSFENQFLIGRPRLLASLGSLVSGAIKDVTVNRLVVWEQLQPRQIALINPLEKVLPDEWRHVSQTDFAGRDHWTWTDYYVFRRHVYEKR